MMQQLRIELTHSAPLAIFWLAIHFAAIIIVSGLSLPIGLKVGIIVLCILQLLHVLHRHVWLNDQRAIAQFWQEEKALWGLQQSNGNCLYATLHPNSFASTFLVVLNFKVLNSRKRCSVIIIPGMLEKNLFRRLLVYLRTMKMNNL